MRCLRRPRSTWQTRPAPLFMVRTTSQACRPPLFVVRTTSHAWLPPLFVVRTTSQAWLPPLFVVRTTSQAWLPPLFVVWLPCRSTAASRGGTTAKPSLCCRSPNRPQTVRSAARLACDYGTSQRTPCVNWGGVVGERMNLLRSQCGSRAPLRQPCETRDRCLALRKTFGSSPCILP